MKKLLRIDASLRKEGSHSRHLANYFEKNWLKAHPTGKVIYKDLTKTEIPHLQNETVEAFHIPLKEQNKINKQATRLSDQLISELKSADYVLISSPLYNLNIPSTLKSYLDHIIRSGHTFRVNKDGSYQGLLENIKAFLITTKGETYKGTAMASLDFQEPYLKTIFGFINLELKAIFSLEGTAYPELLEKNNKIQQEKILMTLQNI
ncbi:NAD(P)H-dependent oxidoreductase [Postechiella marina]|uniref:FMN dependent NADH:quinone oxidoreductase n=1 Tax=Postechiella marina TaxID=943941 RepID=A0ABP8CF68_9FLAO